MAKAKKKSKLKFILKIILSILFLSIIIGGITGYSYYKKIYFPNVKTTKQKTYLYIPTGSNFNDLLQILNKDSLLLDVSSFEWLSEQKNYVDHIKPGKYKISNDMSNNELINLLRSGEQEPVNLVIRGFRTKEELAGKIGANLEVDSATIVDLFESESFAEKFGFTKNTIMVMIIPNTYEFNWNTSADEFFARMAKEYKAFWNDERQQNASNAGMTQTEVSILASIVQQETYKNDEMSDVAGVYVNRLKKGMLLQADPTVIYAVGDFTLKRVLKKHLETDSPYNTYRYQGLPPGPICIPWPKTLDAVLNYTKHQYIYFCAKEDFSGYHNFAKTLNEHEKNATRYRNALNKRKIK
ncbi:MAG: endolytic transglycosylase MltG [Bacteroidia bacterium]|nr:endolytic transglycosylase MltG [Bacteroidia bacterium]